MKLYLAGPLFTAAERNFNVALRDALERAGHRVWLPQEREPRDKTPVSIFAMDLAGIEWADVVVACMDGPDPDSGTAWECGYAYACKMPIVLFRTDFRGASDGDAPFNLMLSASANVALTCDGMSVPAIAEKICHHLGRLHGIAA